MTLKHGFVKCLLLVLSDSGWKDQNIDSSFSRQRKPWYGEGIVWLASRVAVWRQSEVSISWAFASPTKSHARLYPFDNQSICSISVRLLFLFCSRSFISRSWGKSPWLKTVNLYSTISLNTPSLRSKISQSYQEKLETMLKQHFRWGKTKRSMRDM